MEAQAAWTAEAFLAADQHDFGPAWRYELVDGQIIAHAAPSPEHAAILAGLTTALGEIVEIYQDELAIHIYRREAEGTWSFNAIGGAAATLVLQSLDAAIPLAEIYEFAMPEESAADVEG